MKKRARNPKRLRAEDFAGEGEPYSEVMVTISIRILGAGITRSRLAVNVYPDPALEPMAIESLRALNKEHYGIDENGNFGACLSDRFSGWQDLEGDYPRINERAKGEFEKECLKAMNAYIKESVDWALMLNKRGMEEAARNKKQSSGKDLVM